MPAVYFKPAVYFMTAADKAIQPLTRKEVYYKRDTNVTLKTLFRITLLAKLPS